MKALGRELIPARWCRTRLDKLLSKDWGTQTNYIAERVAYYNKLEGHTELPSDAITIGEYGIPEKTRAYYFDSMEFLRYFDPKLKFGLIPGDVIHVPPSPAFVKSRPIDGDNRNSVVLKLDKARHFNFIKDDIPFAKKKNLLIGRSGFVQEHRKLFFDIHHEHPLCDLKKVKGKRDPHYLSISQHLDYKFILSLEGYDVATNLKWVMSTNSIAVMPKPKYETWFMEGTLIPDVHYICLSDDFSDLEEKLRYYIDHPAEAQIIVENAHRYVDQFKHREREDVISLMVLQKYFEKTN